MLVIVLCRFVGFIMAFDFISIGKRLKEARINANLTQKELAEIMGVSDSYIKNTERGGKPSLSYLQTIVEYCHVSYDWLLTGEESQFCDQKRFAGILVPANNTSKFAANKKNNKTINPEETRKILALLKENENEIKQWLGEQIRLYLKEQEAGKNESQSDK